MGYVNATAWVGRDDGLLTLDRNANGLIDDASELLDTVKQHLSGGNRQTLQTRGAELGPPV